MVYQKWYIKDYNHSCTWWGETEYLKRYGKHQIGDILYVRETWMMQSMKSFDRKAKVLFKAKPNQELCEVTLSQSRYDDFLKFESKNGWQPSLFMPKEVARLFLKVTDVRIERLQEITDEQALNEGIKAYSKDGTLHKYCVDHDAWVKTFKAPKGCAQTSWQGMPTTAVGAYSLLWDSTIAKKQRDSEGWDANPYVWVIEFEKISKDEALAV